jgi:hypothetical protein
MLVNPAQVEVGRVELPSAYRSLATSTCVVRCSISPRPVNGQRTAPPEPVVKISPAASRHHLQASPILMTPSDPPQTRLIKEREVRNRKGSTYAARAKLSFAGTSFPEDSRGIWNLGTQPRLHHTRRNHDTPKRQPTPALHTVNLIPPERAVNCPSTNELRRRENAPLRAATLMPPVMIASLFATRPEHPLLATTGWPTASIPEAGC